MATQHTLLQDDFSSFSIGAFPYDAEHSAMGEYHFYPPKGYRGGWYDPIMSPHFRGPSWLVTAVDGRHFMEQQRIRNPLTKGVCPMLVKGDERWQNYTLSADVRFYRTDEPAGILFRYQTSLMHYAFTLSSGSAQLWRVEKLQRTLLAECAYATNPDDIYTLTATCRGADLICGVNGQALLRATDTRYTHGKIAISAYMPAAFTNVRVETDAEGYSSLVRQIKADEARVAQKRLAYPQPRLAKVIDLKDFGAARQLRFGHLMGGADWYFIIAQHQKRVFKDRYGAISCLTAVNLQTGQVLWQRGEPQTGEGIHNLTCDLPFQIYDIDGDGIDEVIMAEDFKLKILDGRTGKVKKWIHTPENTEDPEKILGIEFQKHGFDRLNVDAIRIINVSGNDRPTDILIKDRYARLWVYDKDLNLLWKFGHNNTGHFPYAWDADGDGRDEIFSCYNMIDSDGTLLWQLPIDEDHTDEIIVGRFDPEGEEQIAIVSGWEGFMLVDKDGTIKVRDINGHGQRISAANYCPGRPGFEIATTTYWEYQGILYLYDCKGREIWHKEPGSNGNIIAPVNWLGDGTELILLNGNTALGGMVDGEGDTVVTFPDDGHPDLCAEVIDLFGDGRDEIVLWDEKRMYIYTQDRPCTAQGRVYRPHKYPHHNCSNYRGEYSYPNWEES